MAVQSLAIKYRPQTFDDVTEQGEIKTILKNQLKTGEVKNAYLFTGGAGTGKTTCARIFAKEINKGEGTPIELDAASNNSVEDVRDIISRAKTASINSEYKVFILDEVHMLSNSAWNAMLKLLEEPPMKSIFIMCTTDPQKIPKTILSRVQRYDFQRISTDGIYKRLEYIYQHEIKPQVTAPIGDAMYYIAKVASGGMRDAITMMDKCLAYTDYLTVDTVLKALGLADYATMSSLLMELVSDDNVGAQADMLQTIDGIHMSGKDLKQFMKQFTNFVLDVNKYSLVNDMSFVNIPVHYKGEIDKVCTESMNKLPELLSVLVRLNADIKWDTSPKATIEATLLLYMEGKL